MIDLGHAALPHRYKYIKIYLIIRETDVFPLFHIPNLHQIDLNMFKFIVLIAALLATASAFAPVGRVARASTLQMADFSKEIGAQVPLGYWDPLGLLKDADQETFDLYVHCHSVLFCVLPSLLACLVCDVSISLFPIYYCLRVFSDTT
jgi:hypothetical protein